MYRSVLMVLALAFMLLACSDKKIQPANEAIDTVPVMVTQLKKCSRLYTTEIRVHKIITHNDEKSIKGSFLGNKFNINLPLSKRQVAIPMEATLKAYVDFGSFTKDNVKRKGDRIEITLPDPQIELTGTRIDNKGINIMGNDGCQARAVYDGEVSAVLSYGGTMVVMLRHGAYISVYANLKSVSVSRGQKVNTRQALGAVGTDNILQFQLRKERAKLNPEAWLGK